MAKDKKEEVKVIDPKEILSAHLKENENDHLNFVDETFYKISTGSLMLDIETDGGLTPGLHRFLGPPESGKSSETLEVARNFLQFHSNGGNKAKVLYIKAEGRLSENIRERTGLPFVWKAEEWEDGSVFVLESNCYEFIINLLRKLVTNSYNKETKKTEIFYCFIFDSMDGLSLKADLAKEFEEGSKVAGAPALSKKFLQKMGNAMSKYGHLTLMVSQYSTDIVLDSYAKAENKVPTQGRGGWGVAHYCNFAIEFLTPYKGSLILDKPKEAPSMTNPPKGRWVEIRFKKSPNEKTFVNVSYPVRFGVKSGSTIWKSYEVQQVAESFGFINRKGAWFSFSDKTKEIIKDFVDEIPEKIQGSESVMEWLEANPKVTDALFEFFKSTLINK